MERQMPPSWRDPKAWLCAAGVAGAYFILARLGMLFALPGSLASPVWPPTGFAIAAVALWGAPAGAGVLVGAVAAEFLGSGNLLTAAVLGWGNLLEALVAGLALARLGRARAFQTVAGVGRFIAAAALAPLASVGIGVGALVATGVVGPAGAPQAAWTWYLGDLAGALVVAPPIVLGLAARRARVRLRAEPVLAVATLLLAAALIFGLLSGPPGHWPGLLILLMLPLVWIGARLGSLASSAAVAAVDALAIVATRLGRGPFQADTPNDSFLLLQTFTLTAAALVLLLGAVRSELRRSQSELERLVADRTTQLRAEVEERSRAEAELETAQEVAHIGSWEIDLATGRMTWSGELCRILGLAPGAAAPSLAAFLALVHPDDRAPVEAALQHARDAGVPFAFEYRVQRRDGLVRRLHGQGRVELDAAGRPARLVGTAHDVTERAAQQERFAALLESAPDAMVIADQEGRIVFVNGQLERLFGYARAELLGASVETLIPEAVRGRHVAHRAAFAAAPRSRSMGEGLDLRGRRKDGTEFPVEVSLSPLRTDEGVLVSSAIRDVTERRRAEAALRESLERFKVLADGSPLGIFHTTVQGLVDYANPRWAEIAGVDYRDFDAIRGAVHPDDRDRLTRAWRAAVTRGTDLVAEFRYLHRDGKVVECATRASPVRDASGTITGFVGTVEDVTERHALEARQRELERVKEQAQFKTEFLRTAAHELGNPLTPIKIQLRMLREFVRNPAHQDARKNVDILDRNVERLHLLVRDMLESARLQSGRLRLLPRPVDLSNLVHEVAETFQEAAIEGGVALDVAAPPALELVADPDRLTQVLYNLLSNAMKFTPPGGHIHVEVQRGPGRAEVTVRDTGAGFTAAQAAGLFQPFGQVHDAVPGKGGTGLGLYISKGIVEQHGGALEARSDGPGTGATFTLWVPLVAAPQPEPQPAVRSPDATPGKLFSS